MTSAPTNSIAVLGEFLKPLKPWLENEAVENIDINGPGYAFVDVGQGPQRVAVEGMTFDSLMTIVQLIANLTQQMIGPEKPRLAAHLPTGERIQAFIPPVVPEGTIGMSIRKRRAERLTLDELAGLGMFEGARCVRRSRTRPLEADPRIEEAACQGDAKKLLLAAVLAKRNIVVSGQTNTGKTTLMNALIEAIPESERVITIEDARELTLARGNALHLVASYAAQGIARVTTQDLLSDCLRSNPERIILGEVRGAEAYTFLHSINTGHPGSITSLHADSAGDAPMRLADAATEHTAARSGAHADLIYRAAEYVDVFAHLVREGGRRRVDEVHFL